MIRINDSIFVAEHEVELSFSRSSGAGGQNVNKVNSKVTLKWNLESSSLPPEVMKRFIQKFSNQINKDGELVLQSDKYREQPKNIDDCRSKLQKMLMDVVTPPKKRKATKPSKGARERRMAKKREMSEKKQNRQKVRY